MKKLNMMRNIGLWAMLIGTTLLMSCNKDDAAGGKVVASFQYEVSAENFLTVNFSNFSKNADSYSWDFGDLNTSIEADPSHTFAEAGTYTVTLTAIGDKGEASKSETIEIIDPDQALTKLAGAESKTWKLYREGISLQWGSVANTNNIWSGLTNNGARPCLYEQTFTFERNGTFVFDDKGYFWGEYSPWLGTAIHETCFEVTAGNMKNLDNADVSAWGSGTHSYAYNATSGQITLTGLGAWMGFVNVLGGDVYSNIPTSSRVLNVTIAEETGYDIMTILYTNSNDVWTCKYVSYDDWADEPDLVTELAGFGTDLEDITPSALGHTFETTTSFDEIGTINGASIITVATADPAGVGSNVGKFERVTSEQYQEAKLHVDPPKDINFSNFNTVSIDVYIPSTNTYGTLTKNIIVGLSDESQTEQWWTDVSQYEYDGSGLAEDQWHTLSWTLSTPTSGSGGSPLDRNDFDTVFINIGGGGHNAGGTFYIRNLVFSNQP